MTVQNIRELEQVEDQDNTDRERQVQRMAAKFVAARIAAGFFDKTHREAASVSYMIDEMYEAADVFVSISRRRWRRILG